MDFTFNYIQQYGWSILGAVITFVVGWWLIKVISNVLVRVMEKSKLEASLVGFMKTFMDALLKILLFIICLSMAGVDMTPFLAILCGLSVAIGFAMKDSFGNIAAGIFILFFKPLKVGEYVEAGGYSGTVNEIGIMNTILKSVDNRQIIYPNGQLVTSVITNYSREDIRRVSLVYGVGYESDIDRVKQLLKGIVETEPRLLDKPEPQVILTELADSSVNFTIRAWSKASDFWPVQFDLNQKVFKVLNENGINIPFPQMDLHVKNT